MAASDGWRVVDVVCTSGPGDRPFEERWLVGDFMHHNGVAQVFGDGENRARLVWTADLLPTELAGDIGGMMETGIAVIKRTLEQATAQPRVA